MMKLSDALRALGLDPDERPTRAAARDCYHALALRCHPDRGGSAEEFARLEEAYRIVRQHLAQPRRCEECEGHGSTVEYRGFHSVGTRCAACRGTGVIEDG